MWFLPLRNSLIVCSPIHTHFGRFDFHVQLSPWRISLLWLLVRFRFFGRFCVCALVWLVKFHSEKWQKFIKWKIPSASRSFEMEYCLCFILFIWVNNFFLWILNKRFSNWNFVQNVYNRMDNHVISSNRKDYRIIKTATQEWDAKLDYTWIFNQNQWKMHQFYMKKHKWHAKIYPTISTLPKFLIKLLQSKKLFTIINMANSL